MKIVNVIHTMQSNNQELRNLNSVDLGLPGHLVEGFVVVD